jgi:DNA invertase Pin-like site-specific DNA recombinase
MKSKATLSGKAVVLRRVSTEDQGKSGLGLDAQLHTCDEAISKRGWDSIAVFTEVMSAFTKPLAKRPAALDAIDLVRSTNGILVVAKGDRLSRRMKERLELIEQSQDEGWGIFLCDLPEADPTTAGGWLMQSMFAMLAEYERRIISERTSDAMHALIRAGGKVGRPRETDAGAAARATVLRDAGMGWTAIARVLDAEGFTPPRGALWNRNTVRHMVTGDSWGKVTRQLKQSGALDNHGQPATLGGGTGQ